MLLHSGELYSNCLRRIEDTQEQMPHISQDFVTYMYASTSTPCQFALNPVKITFKHPWVMTSYSLSNYL